MEFEGRCHFCGGDIFITETRCKSCGTTIKGEFESCGLCKLSLEAKQFIKVFVECDGNIKNVEKALGISYPTVKSRLALVQEELKMLNLNPELYYEDFSKTAERKAILKSIENGEISVDEALNVLNQIE